MQIFLSLVLGMLAGLLAGGGIGVWVVTQRLRQRALDAPAQPARLPRPVRRDDAYFRGDDLLRYPRRLGELQTRLCEQHEQALEQAAHLDERREALAERLVALGATRGESFEEAIGTWTVMHDPEGNEFCLH